MMGWTWATHLHHALTPMMFNTALVFAALGVAVMWLANGDESSRAEWLGAAVVLVAALTGAQTLFGFELGIDQWWGHDLQPRAHPGRMAPATSVAFTALGLALVLRRQARPWRSQALTLIALMIAVLSLCGYVYSAHSLYTLGGLTSVAPHTALGFLVVSVSLLLTQPGRGVTKVLVSDTQVGRTLRRAIPLIGVAAPTYGWLCMRGHQLGYYDANFGFALVVLGNMTSVTFTTLFASWRVHRLQKRDADDQRLLMDLGELLGSHGNPDDTLEAATRLVGQTFATSRCLFSEVDLERGIATVRARYEPGQEPLPAEFTLASFSDTTMDDLRSGRAVANMDARHDERTAATFEASYRPLNVRASVTVPLMRNGQWIGSFAVASQEPRVWQAREVTLMQHVASHTWAWYEHHKALVERQRLLNDVTRLAQELEQRVDERTSALRGALDEKEVLIKEVHHRVKNNLQVISSLLHLQGGHVRDPRARAMFSETQDRVQSIALVHEKLYQSRDLSHINFEDYVRVLVRGLLHSLNAEQRGICALVDVQGVCLSVDVAVPCGMIINELVTNALKHAFVADRGGQVTVTLRQLDAERVELVVSDDGCGMAEDVDPRRVVSLGLDLVFAFADQIGATVSCHRTQGTSFRMVFPKGTTHAS